ncbi:MAG: VOC family protein [Anaerolineae bacterium]
MNENDKPRVRAIGGVFFRSADPEKTREWYGRHLGLSTDSFGTNFAWRHKDEPEKAGYSQWSAFDAETEYFGKREQQFMINYRVDHLDLLIEKLKADGVEFVGEMQQEAFGRFVHIIDNDGRRVELWEPIDDEYEKILNGITK